MIDILDPDEDYGLHFAETGVLALPGGYTVNSPDEDVGGNVWCGTVPVSQTTLGAFKSLYR